MRPLYRLFQAASKWDPKLPLVYRNIGLAALRLGNFSESLRMLRLAITADAKDDRSRSLFVQTSLEWAKALDKQGKLSQSAKVLEEASRSRRKIGRARGLATVYGKLGKHADAKRHAEQLERLESASRNPSDLNKSGKNSLRTLPLSELTTIAGSSAGPGLETN